MSEPLNINNHSKPGFDPYRSGSVAPFLNNPAVFPSPKVLLSDNFHDANGTALAAHAPQVGGAWTDLTAGLVIEDDALSTTAGGLVTSSNDVGVSDVIGQLTFQFPNAADSSTFSFNVASNSEFSLGVNANVSDAGQMTFTVVSDDGQTITSNPLTWAFDNATHVLKIVVSRASAVVFLGHAGLALADRLLPPFDSTNASNALARVLASVGGTVGGGYLGKCREDGQHEGMPGS